MILALDQMVEWRCNLFELVCREVGEAKRVGERWIDALIDYCGYDMTSVFLLCSVEQLELDFSSARLKLWSGVLSLVMKAPKSL